MAKLFLPVGIPGAGKTTTCKLVSDITGARHIWVDYERRRRAGTPTYAKHETMTLYGEIDKEVENLLADGHDVIYDTAFNYFMDRKRLSDLAKQYAHQAIVLWVKTPVSLAKERALYPNDMSTRVLGGMNEADFERLCGVMEEPRDDEDVLVIDGRNVDYTNVCSQLARLEGKYFGGDVYSKKLV